MVKTLLNTVLKYFGFQITRKNPFYGKSVIEALDARLSTEENITLSYSNGKTASRAVAQSLQNQGFNIIHKHYLSNVTFAQREYTFNDCYFRPTRCEKIYSSNSSSKYLRNRLFLEDKKKLKGLKIITTFREPIDNLISAFFGNLTNKFSFAVQDNYKVLNSDSIKSYFLQCIDIYLEVFVGKEYMADENYKELWSNHKDFFVRQFLLLSRWPLIWFDRELKGVFDFDIYSHSFDKKLGYGAYHQNDWSILVMKYEKFSEVAEIQIGKFSNSPDFRLESANVGLESEYGDFLRDFRSSIVLPQEFVDYQYSSKFARFFYTAAELEQFSRRWVRA